MSARPGNDILSRSEDANPNRKLSWSKTGGIAHITRDGQVVNIHSFARSPGQAGFALSKPQPLQPPQSHFQYPLMHLAWAQTGSDLAVFNSAGGVAIYTTYIAINRMRPTAMIPFEGTEAEGAVVGVRWLRPDRTVSSRVGCDGTDAFHKKCARLMC